MIATASERDLADIIYLFGEERHSRAVARAIVAARKEAPITTTQALADIVARVVRSKPNEIHPATRTFQALRIFVNEELDELQRALTAAERVLMDSADARFGGPGAVAPSGGAITAQPRSFLVLEGAYG